MRAIIQGRRISLNRYIDLWNEHKDEYHAYLLVVYGNGQPYYYSAELRNSPYHFITWLDVIKDIQL